MQFSRLAADYIRYAAAYKGHSHTTCETYAITYHQFLGYLVGRRLSDDIRHFTIETVEDFAKYLTEVGKLHPNTVGFRLTHLASLARYGMKTRDPRGKPLLAMNPVAHVERPQKQRPVKKFLYQGEVAQLAAAVIPPNEAMARDLWLDTALRLSELLRANVEDVWVDGKGRGVLSVTVKGRGRQVEKVHIPLSAEVTARLKDWLLARNLPGPKEPLLVSQQGQRYKRTGLYQVFIRLGRIAGITRIRTNPHAIRHTYNMVAREQGIDVNTRAKLLNHSDIRTLQQYDYVFPEETAGARERVREALKAGVSDFSHSTETPPSAQKPLLDLLKDARDLPEQ